MPGIAYKKRCKNYETPNAWVLKKQDFQNLLKSWLALLGLTQNSNYTKNTVMDIVYANAHDTLEHTESFDYNMSNVIIA